MNFVCALCTHTGEIKPNDELTMVNGHLVCGVHMIYVENLEFTDTFQNALALLREDLQGEEESVDLSDEGSVREVSQSHEGDS